MTDDRPPFAPDMAALEQRMSALAREVVDLVARQRNDDYGDPSDDFEAVVDAWDALTRGKGTVFTPQDHCLYMAVVKLARELHEHKRDNLIDAAAYLLICADLWGW